MPSESCLADCVKFAGSGTFVLDAGQSSDWQAAVAAATADVDDARSDVSISPHCSEEEFAMLLEALNQPSDPKETSKLEYGHA